MSLWPQYTFLGLIFFSLGASIADHGKPRKPENAWTSFIASGITLFLLWNGGFFRGMP